MATDSDSRVNRLALALATLRPTQKELSELRSLLLSVDLNELSFALKQIESEVAHNTYLSFVSSYQDRRDVSDQLFKDINEIRTRDLKQTIPTFAAKMKDVIRELHPQMEVPDFDSRRGFREWVRLLSDALSPSEIYQVAAILQERSSGTTRSWSISRT